MMKDKNNTEKQNSSKKKLHLFGVISSAFSIENVNITLWIITLTIFGCLWLYKHYL